jgi:hypothetical protein
LLAKKLQEAITQVSTQQPRGVVVAEHLPKELT